MPAPGTPETILNLALGAPLSGPEAFEMVQGGGSFRTTASALATYLQAIIAIPSAANPTATIGTSAVNGSASTFMRSDAAPAAPLGSSSVFGLLKVDGSSIVAVGGVASAVSQGVSVSSNSSTSYTLVLGDANGYKRMNSSSSMSLIIPPNSSVPFAIGTTVAFEQEGAGAVGFVAGAGVTIVSTQGFLHTNGQYAVVQIIQKSLNLWTLYGNLAT